MNRPAPDLFDPLGPTYARVGARLSLGQDPRWRRRLVDRLAPRDGERILDVATGTGLVARELRRRADCDVVGLDLSAGMLAAADRQDGVRYVRGRAERLPFPDASFDALSFTYLLRYVDDPAATLKELARVVRPGGRVASLEFAVPRPLPFRLGWWLYTRLALRLAGALLGSAWSRVGGFLGGSISDFARSHPIEDLERMWRAAGLDDVRSDRLTLGAAVVTWATRRDGAAVPEGRVTSAAHAQVQPAFYALARGGWRDYVTLLHPPYTAWHLSYVVLGAALAPALHLERLAATLLAFALALGVGVHALDEMRGRPLRTRIPDRVLAALALLGIGLAVAIGVIGATLTTSWLLAFVIIGTALALLYPLELAGGKLHSDLWFALGWGAFPVLTAYFAQAETLGPVALFAAGYAAALSYAQRRLSTWVRRLRRKATAIEGTVSFADGSRERLDRAGLIGAPESALRWLTWAAMLVAFAALALRLGSGS